MTNSGLIVPKNLELGPASSLTEYFEISIRMTFIDYFDDLYYPYFKEKDPTITRQDLIDEASLESIRDFLAHAEHVGLMSNEDDIILAPGQIEYPAGAVRAAGAGLAHGRTHGQSRQPCRDRLCRRLLQALSRR